MNDGRNKNLEGRKRKAKWSRKNWKGETQKENKELKDKEITKEIRKNSGRKWWVRKEITKWRKIKV